MMENTTTAIVITIACPNEKLAQELARKLVENKLVACAQIAPIFSVYEWNDSVVTEPEYILNAKTLIEKITDIEFLVEQAHPYEVPEIIATPIIWGKQQYLDWIEDVISSENL